MRISRRQKLACLISAGSLLGSLPSAYGNADSWKTIANGIWGTGANWVDGTTPGNTDSANFNLFGSYTVTFNAAPLDIQNLSVPQGAVIFTSSGGAKTLNVTAAAGSVDLNMSGSFTGFFLGTSGNSMHLVLGDDLSVQSSSTLQVQFGLHLTASDL